MSPASSEVRRAEPAVAMTVPQVAPVPPAARTVRTLRRSPERLCRILTLLGFGFVVPVVRLACGEDPRMQLRALWQTLGVLATGRRAVGGPQGRARAPGSFL